MMLRNVLSGSLLMVLLFMGCNEPSSSEGYFFAFRPRTTTKVWACPGIRQEVKYENYSNYEYLVCETYILSADDFFLAVSTGNQELLSILGDYQFVYFPDEYNLVDGEHNSSLEQELEYSYDRKVSALSKKAAAAVSASSSYEDYMVPMEYRMTGVKGFSIKAIDASLFGKEAGESLNEYFEIISYYPDYIASSLTRGLLYGFTDTDKPTTIDDWLRLIPLAQPSLLLRFRVTPDPLPVDTRFLVEMETEDGSMLTDTTALMRLTH